MRIERLDLTAFGRFTNQSFDLSAGPHQLHILYGPNESGKSTSLRAITGLLFGIQAKTTDDFKHAKRELRIGAKIVGSDGIVLDCIRRRGNKNTLLLEDGKELADTSVLDRMLGGVDRATFLSQFGLTHTALVQGGQAITCGSGDLGEILFSAGSGLEQLSAVKGQLESEWKTIFLPSGSKPILNQHLSELKKLRARLREAQLPPAEYKRRCTELQESIVETDSLAKRVDLQRRKVAQLKAQLDAFPKISQRTILKQQLAELADVPPLDEAFRERRRDADLARRNASQRKKILDAKLESLKALIDGLPPANPIRQHATTITRLYEQIGVVRNAREDLSTVAQERDQTLHQIEEVLRDLGRDPDQTNLDQLRIVDSVRQRIEGLAESHALQKQQLDVASTEFRQLTQESERLSAERGTLKSPKGYDLLANRLQRVGNPQILIEHWETTTKEFSRIESRALSALRRLRGFAGALEEAVQLAPPLDATIQRLTDKLADATARREQLEQRLQEQQNALEANRRDLDTLRHKQAIPSESELTAIRKSRNQKIQDLSDQLAQRQVDAAIDRMTPLQNDVQEADVIADRLRHEAERVARRAECEATSESLQRILRQLEEQRSQEIKRYEERWSDWTKIWEPIGVDVGTPVEMAEWTQKHRALITLCEDLKAARLTADSAKNRLETACLELKSVIGPTESVNLDLPPQDVLISLYEVSRTRLDQLSEERSRYQSVVSEHKRVAAAIPIAKSNLDRCQKQFDAWQTEWAEVAERVGSNPKITPSGLIRTISQIDTVVALKQTHLKASQRVYQMESTIENFENRLSDILPKRSSEIDSLEAAEQMMNDLQADRENDAKRQSLLEQIEQIQAEREATLETEQRNANTLMLLCEEAGCESWDELPNIEQQATYRARVEREWRTNEEHLAVLAMGSDLKTFVDQAEKQDVQDLENELHREQAILDDEQGQLNALRERLGTLRQDVDAMNGEGTAATCQQEIQNILTKIRRASVQYATLRIANVALLTAIERYRQENQEPVLERAAEMFRVLTCDDYQSLQAELDEKGNPTLFGVRGNQSVPANRMSDGTADALYLALRLASLETQLMRRSPLPFIIDDILIQFDDARAGAALSVLSELSQKTQVILFSHHQHLLDIAVNTLQAEKFHVHHLEPSRN